MIQRPPCKNCFSYPHQREAIEAWDKLNTLDSYSTLFVLPTGGGKTYTASTWLLTHALDNGKKVLWMAHRHLLLDQAAESFCNFAYDDVIPRKKSFFCRIISGKHENSASISAKDDLLIVSKDSIRSDLERLDAWLASEDEIYFVVDEAHHATAKTYKRVIEHIKSKVHNLKIIGLTATPTRTFEHEQPLLAKIFPDGIGNNGQPFNNANTTNRLGMVYKIGLKELIHQQILSRPKFDSYETQIEYGENLGINALRSIRYHDKLPPELEKAIARDEGRNKLIVQSYKKNAAKYGKTLVFTVSIEHTKILTERFNQAGIKAAYVVSGTPHDERERIYNAYRNGDLQVLVNVNILTEGTDLPMTQTVFLTRPTTSTILMTHIIGRALRGPEAGGTEYAYIVSFVDRWKERIMWVVPEFVYDGEPDPIIDLPPIPQNEEDEEVFYISQEKILEFAKILNEAIDTRAIEAIPFIERIPLGMYAFTYENKDDGAEEGSDISYQVMVYSSTKDAYEKFMAALPGLFQNFNRFNYTDESEEYLSTDTLRQLLDYCEKNFFSGEMIPPYDENDIRHIIEYYAQKEACPQFYTFAQADRERLDVATVANDIWNKDMGERAKANYLNELWNNGDKNIWRIFFVDKRYFLRMIEIELTKLAHPEIYAPDQKKSTPQPTIQTVNGDDFEATVMLPKPVTRAVDFSAIDELITKLKNEIDRNKLAVKDDILSELSKLKAQAQQNRDAAAMNKVGNYYGKIHEHAKADDCYAQAKSFKS